jgi:hypothetical protein
MNGRYPIHEKQTGKDRRNKASNGRSRANETKAARGYETKQAKGQESKGHKESEKG